MTRGAQLAEQFRGGPLFAQIRQLLLDADSGLNGSEAVKLNRQTFRDDMLFRATRLRQELPGEVAQRLLDAVYSLLDGQPHSTNELATTGRR